MKTVTISDRRRAAKLAREYRTAKGLSQTALAKIVATNQPTISEAERAFPSVPPRVVRALIALAG